MRGSEEVDSPMPRALLRSPRMVRRKQGTLALLVIGRILTAPILAVTAALLAFVMLEPIVAFLLPAQSARIVGQWRDDKARGGSVFYIEYQFDRTGYVGRDEVLPGEYRTFSVGQAVKAHLIRLGPLGYSLLDRSFRTYARDRMIVWFAAAFALAIGSVLFFAIWFLPWRSHWLARNGSATFGAVVAKSIFYGGRRQYSFTLTYQFKVHGQLYARRIRISSHRYDSALVADLVIVLFDPKRPARNIVYDYCDFIAS
jgi:hypothetical protein